MREEVKNIIAQSLGLEVADVDETKRLREDLSLGHNDLDEILNIIRQRYNLQITSEELEDIETVGELLDAIETLPTG